jgi:sensor histidine kinase YesM
LLNVPSLQESTFDEPSATRTVTVDRQSLWPLIWSVTGLYWLTMTIADLLVYSRYPGKTLFGIAVPSPGAIALAYLFEYFIFACLYYWSLSPKWPQRVGARAAMILWYVLLALLFAAISGVITGLAVGIVDHNWQRLWHSIEVRRHLQWELIESAWRGALPMYVLGLLLVAFVRLVRQYHDESLRAAKLSAEYARTRLGLLSAQLQPHFLFNALHVITELVADEPTRATEMLERLGVFLRHALETSKQPWVSISAEMCGLEAYLGVQQVRFGERLAVLFAVDPATSGYLLPSLLLQPLVENAVEHGRNAGKAQLIVSVAVSRKDDRIHIVISNSTPRLAAALPTSAYGYGLTNVTTRLRAAYGPSVELSLGPDASGGTQAEMYLPIRENR